MWFVFVWGSYLAMHKDHFRQSSKDLMLCWWWNKVDYMQSKHSGPDHHAGPLYAPFRGKPSSCAQQNWSSEPPPHLWPVPSRSGHLLPLSSLSFVTYQAIYRPQSLLGFLKWHLSYWVAQCLKQLEHIDCLLVKLPEPFFPLENTWLVFFP